MTGRQFAFAVLLAILAWIVAGLIVKAGIR